nr:hypothetical protein Itr_chr14CG13010 [Ipomoea trifida]
MRRSPAFANHHATPFFSTSDTADARHSEPLTSDTVDVATVDTRCCRRQQREGRQPPAILASRLQPRYITAAIHHCRRLQKTMTTAVSRHGDRDRQRSQRRRKRTKGQLRRDRIIYFQSGQNFDINARDREMRRSPAFANHHATPFFSTSDTADARHSEPLTSDTVDVATVDTRCCRRQQREGRQPPAILASRLQPRYITAAIHHCRRLQKTMTTAVSHATEIETDRVGDEGIHQVHLA